MKVLITGGAGFLGRRLAARLLSGEGLVVDGAHRVRIEELVLADRVEAPPWDDGRVRVVVGDIAEAGFVESLVDRDTRVVFHLAAVVSGEAEAQFELGMAVNFDASRRLLETCRSAGHRPRVVFTSSVAVYGGELPDMVRDDTALNPLSSYGTEKAMAELLLAEYHRRGFVDGRALRLPTVSVRPGRPNQAASSFASSIVREPLIGEEAICPVPADTRVWLMSPRCALDCLVLGAELDADALGDRIAVNLPGMSLTVEEMLEALVRVAGEAARTLVRFEPDPVVLRIVGGWPGAWDTARSLALGFPAERGFDDAIRDHVRECAAGKD